MHLALKDSVIDKNITKLKEWNGIALSTEYEDEATVSLTEKSELGVVFQCRKLLCILFISLFFLLGAIVSSTVNNREANGLAVVYKVIIIFLNLHKIPLSNMTFYVWFHELCTLNVLTKQFHISAFLFEDDIHTYTHTFFLYLKFRHKHLQKKK